MSPKERLSPSERQFPFSAEKWFQVSQVAENVHAIREPHHDQDVLSYFIQGQNTDVLIDSGMGLADISRSEPLARRDPQKELLILLSHTHWDHMGGAATFSNVGIIDNLYERVRLETGWRSGEMPGFDRKYFIDIEIPDSYSPDKFEIPGTPPSQVLHDGERIDIGGDTLQVISTPGHTTGSTSFYLERKRFLFTGDTLYAGPLYLHMLDSSYDTFLASVQKLASCPGNLAEVFPGHNDTVISPEKFRELIGLIQGARVPDFTDSGVDDFNRYIRLGWYMKDMGDNRTFSLMLPVPLER